MATPTAEHPKSYLLGLFVVGQIAFLAVHNGIGWLEDARDDLTPPMREAVEKAVPGWPAKSGHAWEWTRGAHDVARRYAEATGQHQSWSLFAPSIGRECVFVALELRWKDGRKPLKLLSPNEPSDLSDYVRVGQFRLRRLENNLALTLRTSEGENDEDRRKRWSKKIKEFLEEYDRILSAFVRWRVDGWRRDHPGEPLPNTVLLSMRRLHINDIGADAYWDGPFEVPIAVFDLATGKAVERFDPVADRMTGGEP